MKNDRTAAASHSDPDSADVSFTADRRTSKVRTFGRVGLALWAVWVLAVWRLGGPNQFDGDWWWRQVLIQATFWLALLFTFVWVAATVWRDELSRR